MLRVRAFGPLALEVDGRAVPEIAGLRPRSVLAWLLLHPGAHARARVAAQFWPGVLDTSARASLRSALWTIRGALDAVGGGDYLATDRDSVGIAERLQREVDVERFDGLCGSERPDELERALELARSPLLTDLADDWVLEARDDCAERAAAAALRLAELAEAAGDLHRAAAWTRRALVHARLDEATHRLLVRRLAGAGERAQAIAALRRFETLLAAEFGTAPSPQTRLLAAELSAPAERAVPAGASPTPRPLVGRQEELARLASAWRAAERGRGGVAVIAGPAGIGKTTLAGELARVAEAGGALCVAGAALDLDGAPPFAAWLGALGALVAAVPPPPATAAWAADLARLCPAVEQRWARAADAPMAEPALGRARLFESVLQALEWAAAQRPLVVLLEDLHRADGSSLALLAHAGRRLGGVRALILTTRRSAPRPELDAALDALAQAQAAVAEVVLGPLPERDVEAIVERTAPRLGAGARRRVIAAAEGNPLLAVQGARAALGGQDPAQALRGFVRGPRERLPAGARLLVDLAAVAARPLELGEAAELVGAERFLDAVGDAAAAGLLESDERRLRFPHALVREACHAEIDAARRPSLHARLAAVLGARRRPEVAEVARHLLLAGDEDQARAYLASAAARARAVGALEQAAGFLAEAAELASPAVAPELWLELAEIEAWRGRREAHDAAFERASGRLEQTDDAPELARAWVIRGRLLRTTLCYPREALDAYRRALDIIDAAGVEAPELRALALAGAAWAEATAGELDAASALIEQVEQLPEAGSDPALRTELALDRATALLRAGRSAEAERAAGEAAELAHAARRADLERIARHYAAAAASARGAFEAALEHARRAGRAAAAGARLESESLAAQAYALSRLGRHPEALAATRRLRAVAGRSGDDELDALAAFDAGCVALAAGDHAQAAELLEQALASGSGRLPRAVARLRLTEARLRAAGPEAAAEELGRLPFEPVTGADLPETLVPQLARLEGLVADARGDSGEALERLREAEASWRRLLDRAGGGDALSGTVIDLGRAPISGLVELRAELGRVLAERALVAAAAGDATAARAAATEAARLAREAAFGGYADTLRRARSLTHEGVEHAQA